MKVLVSKSELNKFRQRVIKSYPKERIELLWGKMIGLDTFHIYVFDQVIHEATRKRCKTDEDDHECSLDEAAHMGLVVLGTIHSHPDIHNDAAPSESDFDDALEQNEVISGICPVWKGKDGKMHTKVRFWGPLCGVTAQYT